MLVEEEYLLADVINEPKYRFIRAIKPPSHVESQSLERTVEVACRIVSYIPFLSDPVMFPGVCDLWTSAEQFLSIGCGGEEEHAILLCCWLLYFNISAYVLLGLALPEGSNAAYVLAFVNDKTMLLNPSDGNCYSSDDALCPILCVGTAISNQNIYANIQSHQHPSQMSFDFKKSNYWKRLFDKDRDNLESIQPESIRYSEIDDDTITQLRSNLERKLKLRFDETRPYGIPQWNLLASRILREILVEFDSVAISSSSLNSNSPNVDTRLVQLKTSYKVNAVAFRGRYTSFDQLLECLMSTNMHINSEKSVQFALAVHIQPFMNNIVSCSLAVAALVPLINT
ncbi:unnamed protein product [Anisakis simplex]|uniref:Rab3 GTPase-activating protein catalytic subunit n=1 Tax=Anisakis simplex TaxID=6269 RepID=A0A0M3J0H1_ANISI|nr:unnamed protein product [Anisakis simplex]